MISLFASLSAFLSCCTRSGALSRGIGSAAATCLGRDRSTTQRYHCCIEAIRGVHLPRLCNILIRESCTSKTTIHLGPQAGVWILFSRLRKPQRPLPRRMITKRPKHNFYPPWYTIQLRSSKCRIPETPLRPSDCLSSRSDMQWSSERSTDEVEYKGLSYTNRTMFKPQASCGVSSSLNAPLTRGTSAWPSARATRMSVARPTQVCTIVLRPLQMDKFFADILLQFSPTRSSMTRCHGTRSRTCVVSTSCSSRHAWVLKSPVASTRR